MMKRFVVLFSLVAAFTAMEGSANASSLVYIDQADDVALARPDGSGKSKLVSDATIKAAISVDRAGRIAYFTRVSDGDAFHYLIDKNGKKLAGPYLFGDIGICARIPPFRSAFSPDGTWLAATFFRGTACGGGTSSLKTRLIDADGPTLNGSIYGEYSDTAEPRFLPQDQPLLSGIIGGQISIWESTETPTMRPWIALNDANWDIDSFDYHPTQNRMVMEQSPAGVPDEGERRDILLLDFDAPGSANLSPVCTLDGLVANSILRARPRYSPDGSQIAWTSPAGIFTSPAPTNNGGTCTLSPKLVIPGGKDVEWAPFNLGSSPGGSKLRVAGVTGTKRSSFRKGSTVRVTVPGAGVVRVTATVPKATARKLKLAKRPRGPVIVASASQRAAKAGTVSIKLKPTGKVKSAWKKLTGVRVTIKAVQGGKSATRTVKLTR